MGKTFGEGPKKWWETMKRILIKPLVSEKNTRLSQNHNQYAFQVLSRSNKFEIAQAVSKRFGVEVERVRTLIQRGKIKTVGRNIGKKSNFKKAIVTIKEGQKIELFEGV